jgi:hypothetical protein
MTTPKLPCGMTADERHREIVALFAAAVLRLHRRHAMIPHDPQKLSADCLEDSSQLRLTVLPTGLHDLPRPKGPQ